MKVLVTGGAGYIGSTICSALEDRSHTPVVLDSFINGKIEFIGDRICFSGDISDYDLLETIFSEHPDIECTIHCAALTIVGDSVLEPFLYYRENVSKSLEFFNILSKIGKKKIIFSSSASIYANVSDFKVTEGSPLNPLSPYSRSKFITELMLEDLCSAKLLKSIALRYFNPIGSDPKCRSGIHARFPTHVIGKLVDTALGKQDYFEITGVDWPTRDGSGIRDYFHVWDLAQAHVFAVESFDEAFHKAQMDFGCENLQYLAINLGNGTGTTVKELIISFEQVFGKLIRKRESLARPGDVAGSYADIGRAGKYLGWKPQLSLHDGIQSSLAWGRKRKRILGYD
jgi:UDP-glucose 4-epimerase